MHPVASAPAARGWSRGVAFILPSAVLRDDAFCAPLRPAWRAAGGEVVLATPAGGQVVIADALTAARQRYATAKALAAMPPAAFAWHREVPIVARPSSSTLLDPDRPSRELDARPRGRAKSQDRRDDVRQRRAGSRTFARSSVGAGPDRAILDAVAGSAR